MEKKRRQYTEEQKHKIVKEVMAKLPEGASLRGIAKKHGINDGRVHEWIQELGLTEDYTRVRELRAHTFFEHINDIAFLCLSGKVDPNAARVAIDALKWTVSRMNPKNYGERTNNEIFQLRERLRESENRAEHWTELAERAFDFATHAREAFISGGMQTKKEILMALGQNPTMKDGKFSLKANLWLVPISENYPALEKEYRALEPTQFTDITTQNTAKQALCSIWLPLLDAFRTEIIALAA